MLIPNHRDMVARLEYALQASQGHIRGSGTGFGVGMRVRGLVRLRHVTWRSVHNREYGVQERSKGTIPSRPGTNPRPQERFARPQGRIPYGIKSYARGDSRFHYVYPKTKSTG